MKKLALLALMITACTKVDSDDILTSGMYADLSARADGNGTTTVSATLFLGQPINLDYVDLTGDDQLRVSNGGETKVMAETDFLNTVVHRAVFQTDLAGDEFLIDFIRTVDDGAPVSIATLPVELEIAPTASALSRAQAMDLTWSPASDDQMTWNATGDCIDNAGGPIPDDPGNVAIGANTFKKRDGAAIADSCTVTLTVNRTQLGSLDTNYGKGGYIVGVQSRTITFTSTP